MTPTQRSLKHLRLEGYVAEVVEYHGRYGRTHDLLGFIDILAFRPGETLAVQTTSVDHVAHRVLKMEESPLLDVVRAAGWRIVVHGWRPLDYAGRLMALREFDMTDARTKEVPL